jgi:hypothetical protein
MQSLRCEVEQLRIERDALLTENRSKTRQIRVLLQEKERRERQFEQEHEAFRHLLDIYAQMDQRFGNELRRLQGIIRNLRQGAHTGCLPISPPPSPNEWLAVPPGRDAEASEEEEDAADTSDAGISLAIHFHEHDDKTRPCLEEDEEAKIQHPIHRWNDAIEPSSPYLGIDEEHEALVPSYPGHPTAIRPPEDRVSSDPGLAEDDERSDSGLPLDDAASAGSPKSSEPPTFEGEVRSSDAESEMALLDRYDQMCSVNTELREHIIELQEQLKRVLSSQLMSLTDELELMQTESTDWKQRAFIFQALQAENERLRGRVVELEAQQLDVENIPAKGRRLAGILESMDKDSSDDEGVDLSQRVLALEQEVERLTAERERLMAADYYTEMAVLTQERNELEAEIRRLQTLKDDVAENLEEQVEYLQSTIETLVSEKEELEIRIEQQEQMMAAMDELLRADQTSGNGRLQVVAEFLDVFRQSQDDNRRLQGELRSVRRELHAMTQENRGLKARLDL